MSEVYTNYTDVYTSYTDGTEWVFANADQVTKYNAGIKQDDPEGYVFLQPCNQPLMILAMRMVNTHLTRKTFISYVPVKRSEAPTCDS